MQDLLLWRYLRDSDFSNPEELAAHLDELAQEPLGNRTAIFGILDPALHHEDAQVRAAAVRVLGGAVGPPAWRKLVAALRDPKLNVVLAAVEALRISALSDPGRWLHARFHPDPDVRRHAENLGAPFGFAKLFPLQEPGTPALVEDPSLVFPILEPYGSMTPGDDYDAVQDAMTENPLSARAGRLLGAFLDKGTEVYASERCRVAEFLSQQGLAADVLPVLVASLSFELERVSSDMLTITAKGITTLGSNFCENKLIDSLYNRYWQDSDLDALSVLLSQAVSIDTRYWARDRLWATPAQTLMLARLARTFAWGVEMGRFLLGERYQIEMIVNDGDLGYTRLREKKIFINPLPILRGERGGAEIVRALILHEYGHHIFHKGEEAEAVWAQGDAEKLGRLLNLVADEHLERNMRQRSTRHGDLLKTLTSYAFQYNMREVSVPNLLKYLGPSVWTVLPRVPLGAARKPGHVIVASGRFLRELEGAGHSFARFVRALRMGLGNRTGDPKVAQGLALFRSSFRKSTMPQLLDIARRLREIFGDETDMLNDFGMDSLMSGDEAEWLANGTGINQDALQKAVDQVLQSAPDRESKNPVPGRTPAGWGMNQRPEETFRTIDKIVKLDHDPVKHADYARRVARAARQLRRYFQDLGLGLRPQRGRLRGRLFDRTKTRDLILKGDPRILIARKVERFTDLFLGVAIDCSGSMYGDKMEKARLFGTLLAEALSGQPGVDLRIFGFTDKTLFDAGGARRCAVHALQATDGNNDAAALWHIFRLARASRRKAKLLVMISDGLPTECSVAALKALVIRLTRWHYCCAQVAVLPISEICFPHYIVVDAADLDTSVRKFGEVVMRLVGQALGKA